MGSMSLANSAAVYAQQTQPAAAAQQGDKPDPALERKAYDALNACTQEKDCNKKLAMAKEALGIYAKSTYVPYLKDQVNQARGCLLQEALKGEKWGDAFKLGDEVLAEDPDNLNYLLTLADTSGKLAKKSDFSFADKGTQYSKKAIELINQNKVPAGLKPEDWAARKPLVLASMHQNIGLFALKAKNEEVALTELTESVKQDCSDPVTHFLMAQVYNGRYEALGSEYRALPDEDKSGDKGKAILEKINGVVDQLLEAYGKMLAVSDGKTTYDGLRNRVKPAIEELYKFRHEGKTDGLQAFLDGFKGACAPK